MEYETDYKKEFDNLHTGSDYDNWLKQYPEEKAGEYRAFIRDSDNKTWYELDFKRDLKETTKIHFEILDSLVIRKRDDLSTPTCDGGPFTVDDIMKKFDSCSERHENDKKFQEQRYKKLDKVRLEDALKNDSIIPIPEEKYQYFLHNWYHWSFVQEYYEDLENQTKLEDMDSHIEEWREISNKLRKWANIFDTLCDKFKDRE